MGGNRKDPKHFINVSSLVFKNVVGTGCADDPEFSCPAQAPCHGITLDNVKLSGKTGTKGFKMTCENAHGTSKDVVPKSCLGEAGQVFHQGQ